MLTAVYGDQNIQTQGHIDKWPCDGESGTYLAGFDFFFFPPGKFRRGLQLHQSLIKDKSEMTVCHHESEILGSL